MAEQWVSFQERNPQFHLSFAIEEDTISAFQSCSLYKHSKDILEQRIVSDLLTRKYTGKCKKIQQSPCENKKLYIHAAFFLTGYSLGLLHFLIYYILLNEILSENLNIKIYLHIIIYDNMKLCSHGGNNGSNIILLLP